MITLFVSGTGDDELADYIVGMAEKLYNCTHATEPCDIAEGDMESCGYSPDWQVELQFETQDEAELCMAGVSIAFAEAGDTPVFHYE